MPDSESPGNSPLPPVTASPPRLVSDEPTRAQSATAVSLNEVLDDLRSLPDGNANQFLAAARDLAARHSQAIDTLASIVNDRSIDRRLRFSALYVLLFRLRRLRDFKQYRLWVDNTRAEFGSSIPLFSTFLAVYERSLGEDPRSMDRAIRASRKAVDQFAESPGVLHQFAELVASKSELHPNSATSEVEEADRAVRKAIALSEESQPHFWATLARLQALQGDFSESRRSIAEAIELEPSAGQDYALRLTEYQLIETRISFMEERERTDRRYREGREELLSIRSQLLEVLGLLAAVIAFISTTVGIASGKDFQEAARLLLVSGAIIIAVFTAFAYGFRVTPLRRVMLPLLLSLLLLAVALWYDEISWWIGWQAG